VIEVIAILQKQSAILTQSTLLILCYRNTSDKLITVL